MTCDVLNVVPEKTLVGTKDGAGLTKAKLAIARLKSTERGCIALGDIKRFINNGGIGLDSGNQRAVLDLLVEVFYGSYRGSVRDLIDDATSTKGRK